MLLFEIVNTPTNINLQSRVEARRFSLFKNGEGVSWKSSFDKWPFCSNVLINTILFSNSMLCYFGLTIVMFSKPHHIVIRICCSFSFNLTFKYALNPTPLFLFLY